MSTVSYPNNTLGKTQLLSLDFNPQSFVHSISVSNEMIISWPSAYLDAIFVPLRGRPEYISELLSNFPRMDIPIFLLPTSKSDLALVDAKLPRTIEPLWMDDPEFLTTLVSLRCSSNKLCFSYFGEWDLPAKRNYALWYACRHRLNRILLLDDDIRDFQSDGLRAGAKALQQYVISGFIVDDFPDTSAIGHLKIKLGEPLWTFLSGSCIFVRVGQDMGFFPPIYNEDWLFMLPHITNRRVCSLGHIRQKPYDPFASSSVARFQEFGEIIADGLFALVANNYYSERLNPEIWREILTLRRSLLMELSSRTSNSRLRAIVEMAISKCFEVTECDCVRFVDDWESDIKSWNQTLQELKGHP